MLHRVDAKMLELIQDGCYGDHGSLPSIAELAQVVECTRNEIRGSLARLMMVGVVRKTPGRGFCVEADAIQQIRDQAKRQRKADRKRPPGT